MKLINKDIEVLRSILSACKVIGVEGIVIHEGMARGAKPSLDAAILTAADLSVSEALRIGIGRVSELEKRLAIFSGELEIEGKSNEAGDVSMLTLTSGKTKVQFRCTSASLMKYPKTNDDPEFGTIHLNRTEVAQLSKAVKTLSPETIVLQVSRAGTIRLECVDSSNDRFDIELSKPIEYADDKEAVVQTYLAALLIDVLDASAKDAEEIKLVMGQSGSITATARGHTLLIMPQITGEE
jgi:hypothetical protein